LIVCVIGAGYVGLCTAAVLAKLGHETHCIDNDTGKIIMITQGSVPFFEPGLSELVAEQREAGRLYFSHTMEGSIINYSISFQAPSFCW
jgi:UDPglucose 6-dehydrogenase